MIICETCWYSEDASRYQIWERESMYWQYHSKNIWDTITDEFLPYSNNKIWEEFIIMDRQKNFHLNHTHFEWSMFEWEDK